MSGEDDDIQDTENNGDERDSKIDMMMSLGSSLELNDIHVSEQEIRDMNFERGHVYPIGYTQLESQNKKECSLTLQIIIRILLVVVALAWYIITAITVMNRQDQSVDGIVDRGHELTAPMNTYFKENENEYKALLITCGLLMDIQILT